MSKVYLLLFVLGYLIGSIPTGYWLGKSCGVDVRKLGSGNSGATNVFRVLGWKAGLFTLIIDILKGYLPVQILSAIFAHGEPRLYWPMSSDPWWMNLLHPWFYRDDQLLSFVLTLGISTILGHSFSCFVEFHGGKGVATSLGVFAALVPIPSLIAFSTFIVVFAITRYVSLGSLAGSFALAIGTYLSAAPQPLAWIAAGVAGFMVWTHRSNIRRLLNGTENRIEWHKKNA